MGFDARIALRDVRKAIVIAIRMEQPVLKCAVVKAAATKKILT